MKQMRFLGFFSLGLLALALIGSPRSVGANELSVPFTTTAFLGRSIDLDVTLTATDVLQGVQAVADWNPAVLQGVNIAAADGPGEALDGADTVIAQIDAGYFILGAVLDSDPFDEGSPEEIPPGTYRLATVTVQGVAEDSSTAINFADNTYSAAALGPTLDNLVVVDGLSIGDDEGLILTGGTVNVLGIPPGTMTVESLDGGNDFGQVGEGFNVLSPRVLLDSSGEAVQAYVVAVRHDPSQVELLGAGIGGTDAEANDAEFIFIDTFANGALIAVVMDYDPPFEDQTVSGTEGAPTSIASLSYETLDRPVVLDPDSDPPVFEDPQVVAIELVDGVFGNPAQENLIVIAGISKNPVLEHGTLTFVSEDIPPRGFLECAFAAGGQLVRTERAPNGEFIFPFNFADDGFGNLIPDPAGAPAPIEAGIGEEFPVSFYYLSPSDAPQGGVDQGPGGNFFDDDVDLDDPQAVSMAVRYDAGLTCIGTYSTEGTVTEAVGGPGGAEFVNVSCNNDTHSLVIAIQVELTPSNDGGTLPPTSDFLRLIDVDFEVNDGGACGAAAGITFSPGGVVDPAEDRLIIRNVMAIRNRSFPVNALAGAVVTLGNEAIFIRGDANDDDQVDIADSVAIISSLFLTGVHRYELPCEDAADANDDARVDLADSVSLLHFLFRSGSTPPAPGPFDRGSDPTEDELTCDAGRACD